MPGRTTAAGREPVEQVDAQLLLDGPARPAGRAQLAEGRWLARQDRGDGEVTGAERTTGFGGPSIAPDCTVRRGRVAAGRGPHADLAVADPDRPAPKLGVRDHAHDARRGFGRGLVRLRRGAALGGGTREVDGRRAGRRRRARVLPPARDLSVGPRQAPGAARGGRSAPSVYGVVAASRSEPFAGAVRDTLREYGLAVEACNPESGPGQFEINLRAAPALRAADEAFLLKSAVKEIAARRGLLATFMAKPRSDWPGSSCHLHLSLRGADLRHFIGGLLDGMAELTAILAPTPNSYRRFGPYSWAATTATWGVDNRSAGVRAICDGDGIARVEHRQAGADANPYLAAAAALAAGLDGVRRGCEPPPAVDGDVYALADGAVPALPATLGEATDLLERSALARDWLGDDVVDHCVAMRRSEIAAQAAAVTDWETERYLEAL